MSAASYSLLPHRSVIAIGGPDRAEFLQGLISNDINKVDGTRAIYSGFLTAQGRYLHDFFVAEIGDVFYLDCERDRLDDLRRRLSLYKLRAKATLADEDGLVAAAAFGPGAAERLGLGTEPGAARPFAGGVAMTDPRLPALGARLLLPRQDAETALQAAGLAPAEAAVYDRWRLQHGVPDGSRDIEVERGFLLESNFEELHGVDFQKGCYVGQELTARTKYRGVVRKRLMRVDVEGPLPAPGTPIHLGETEAGEMRSGRDGIGLALIRLEQLEKAAGAPLSAGDARIRPVKPDWAAF